MTTSKHNNPYPWGNEVYNFVIPFLGHHCFIFKVCLIYSILSSREEDL